MARTNSTREPVDIPTTAETTVQPDLPRTVHTAAAFGDAHPVELSVEEVLSTELSAAAVPTFTPEVSLQGITAGTIWHNNKRVVGVWTINQDRNSWCWIEGIGWRRLANNSESANNALTILAMSARQSGALCRLREEADGMIHEIYVF
jgi:hypothetical protein